MAILEARYEDAASRYANAVQGNPRFSTLYFIQAAALALAGHEEEARPIARRGLELMPGWRVRMFLEIGMAAAVADKFREGARLLRLPE